MEILVLFNEDTAIAISDNSEELEEIGDNQFYERYLENGLPTFYHSLIRNLEECNIFKNNIEQCVKHNWNETLGYARDSEQDTYEYLELSFDAQPDYYDYLSEDFQTIYWDYKKYQEHLDKMVEKRVKEILRTLD